MKKPILIDLFSGCGGFGLGAEQAGFHSSIAIDIAPELQSAYRLNFPNTNVIESDISEMKRSAWRFLLGKQKIDGVIGGPPCQGFSRIGKNDSLDPRRSLLLEFFKTINIIKPKFFLMENVEGLLDAKNVGGLHDAISVLDKRYQVLEPVIVDASEYGAATKRRRVIVAGFDPSEMNIIEVADIVPAYSIPTTVREAISDVSNTVPDVKGELEYGWTNYGIGRASRYAVSMRKKPPHGLGSNLARSMLLQKKVSGGFSTIHTEKVLNRFRETEPGKIEPISRYPRLKWDGLCPTLRAGTGSDRGSFQAMRPIHPDEPRVITVREAARLQGFPDWFLFHPTKHHSFRMIGNSVSPIMSEAILSKIKMKLTNSGGDNSRKQA